MTADYSNFNARATGDYDKIWNNTGKCVFCDLKDKYIIKEIDGMVLTTNLFPYKVGHLLIIPRRHFESFWEINEIEWQAFYKLSDIGIKLLKKTYDLEDIWVLFRTPKGYNAGKTVNHAHAHLIPFTTELIKFSYEEITESPVDTAQKLRENMKYAS